LDVRFSAEYKCGHTPNSINIPIGSLKQRLNELDKNRMIFIAQESEERGDLAAHILQQAGYRCFIIGAALKYARSRPIARRHG